MKNNLGIRTRNKITLEFVKKNPCYVRPCQKTVDMSGITAPVGADL